MIEKIFFDMDGVLADFELGVEKLCGISKAAQENMTQEEDDAMWVKIKQVDHYYDKLEFMPGAEEMFRTVWKKYGDKVEILSAIPKPWRGLTTSREDKINWIHRLLGEEIVVNICMKEEKKNYCKGKEYILIDDLSVNIEAWESAGGTGICHISPEETIKSLEKIETLE